MKQPEDYLVSENAYKEYMLQLNDGSLVWAYISADTHDEPLGFCKKRGWDADAYQLEDIHHVVQELPEDFYDECSECTNGKIAVDKVLKCERVCDDCKIKAVNLEPFKTNQHNVYKYNNLDELQHLYNALDAPIPDNFNAEFSSGVIDTKGLKDFGLMYTWSHMDDFSDYPLDYCAIIEGVK